MNAVNIFDCVTFIMVHHYDCAQLSGATFYHQSLRHSCLWTWLDLQHPLLPAMPWFELWRFGERSIQSGFIHGFTFHARLWEFDEWISKDSSPTIEINSFISKAGWSCQTHCFGHTSCGCTLTTVPSHSTASWRGLCQSQNVHSSVQLCKNKLQMHQEQMWLCRGA